MDLVVRAAQVPERGETVPGADFGTFPGGKGANQAVAAARQGAQVTMVGCVGDGAFGAQMREALRQDGIDTGHLRVDARAPTGVALITARRAGRTGSSSWREPAGRSHPRASRPLRRILRAETCC
jgi:ribokinase